MSSFDELKEREKKIENEVARLSKNYAKIDGKTRSVIRGLIQRAAFMRVSLAELEDDLNTNGFTEMFAQGDQEPYQRKRPVADLYNTMNANYQKIIKQLAELLPKEPPAPREEKDGFDDFVNSREDT